MDVRPPALGLCERIKPGDHTNTGFIRNGGLHRDLKVKLVSEIIKDQAIEHSDKLRSHENNKVRKLTDISNTIRGLKRVKPNELLT